MRNNIPNNREIATLLENIADLLEAQHANEYRIQAYRSGANLVRSYPESLAQIVLSGEEEALLDLPRIGDSLAGLIREYVKTGKSQLLQRLQGEVTPEELFEGVPGIGKALAERIVKELDIKTLEDLEHAAYDGRLAKVEGFGGKRLETVRLSLAGLLSGFARRRIRSRGQQPVARIPERPSAALLLEVDEEYRRKARNRTLKRIAPKRFNPENRAWLPILHAEKEGWSFTALFSNTVRAHELGKVKDWVVIFYEKGDQEGQATVVTEIRGPLRGRRVVRGREKECMELEKEVVG